MSYCYIRVSGQQILLTHILLLDLQENYSEVGQGQTLRLHFERKKIQFIKSCKPAPSYKGEIGKFRSSDMIHTIVCFFSLPTVVIPTGGQRNN